MKNVCIKVLLLTACFVVLLSPTASAEVPTESWVARYDGPGRFIDKANAIALDASGNVYVTGVSYGGSGTRDDYATVKYDTDGNELWVARYNGPANSFDYAYDIALDVLGNVYVTGGSNGSGTSTDYTTVKYDTDGNELWVARYNGPANFGDVPHAIAVDESSNVYVTGMSEGGIGNSWDYATVKYDTDGNELWVARYDGPTYYSSDLARTIVLDASGNVYVTGESLMDYATIKYDTDGNELWVVRYNGPASLSDKAYAIAVDESSNVYVTGVSYGGSGTREDYATVKYDTDGNELWVARYNNPANFLDLASAIALDASGNVYVTGYSYVGATNYNYATVKYDTDGNELWVTSYDGPGRPGNEADDANAIAVDASGNVYVTGVSYGENSGRDYATVKYDTDGNELWVARYNGPANSTDVARAIALDTYGNVYVTGESQSGYFGSGTRHDYATVKYVAMAPVNDLLTFIPIGSTYSASPDTTGCPASFVGMFGFEAVLTNISSNFLYDLYIKIATLTNGNMLQNADGGLGREGAQMTVPLVHGYSDGQLSPGESVDVPFRICLKQWSPFYFFVDVWGVVE